MTTDKKTLVKLHYVPLYPETPPFEYESDLNHMVEVMRVNGYEVSKEDVRRAWEDYSQWVCAGWLLLPDNDADLVSALLELLDEV